MKKLKRDFYNRDSTEVARDLLGKNLVHQINNTKLYGKIVETEAYMGIYDKAAHAYGGRRTKRLEVMYRAAGHSYIYLIYGMYYCFNVVTREEGIPQCVLIRAIEPLGGLDIMAKNRFNLSFDKLSKKQLINLTNGPGKLCMALNIDKTLYSEDLCASNLYIEEGTSDNFNIINSKRIGIDYAQEAKDYLYRFYIQDNDFVSIK